MLVDTWVLHKVLVFVVNVHVFGNFSSDCYFKWLLHDVNFSGS